MTVFSNCKTLNEMAEAKNWVGLAREFANTTIVEKGMHGEILHSAKETYRRLCELMRSDCQRVPVAISDKASDMFADIWDVEALLMMKDECSKYGKLTVKAMKVLKEYETYRKKAEEVYKLHYYDNGYTEKLSDGVMIRVNAGGVGFIREGKTYVVYFPDH